MNSINALSPYPINTPAITQVSGVRVAFGNRSSTLNARISDSAPIVVDVLPTGSRKTAFRNRNNGSVSNANSAMNPTHP